MTITLDRREVMPEFRVADLAKMTTEEAVLALLGRAADLRASDLFLLSDARYVTVAVRRSGSVDRLAVCLRNSAVN